MLWKNHKWNRCFPLTLVPRCWFKAERNFLSFIYFKTTTLIQRWKNIAITKSFSGPFGNNFATLHLWYCALHNYKPTQKMDYSFKVTFATNYQLYKNVFSVDYSTQFTILQSLGNTLRKNIAPLLFAGMWFDVIDFQTTIKTLKSFTF